MADFFMLHLHCVGYCFLLFNNFIVNFYLMKNSIIVLFLFASFTAFAQKDAFSGLWKEVARTTDKGKTIDFADTIKMNFLPGQEYTWMKKNGFIWRGTYKVENGMLDLGSRAFTIIKNTKNKLVLKDEEAIYEFAPYQEAALAKLPPDATPLPVTSLAQMVGKWDVYKRTSSVTQQKIDYTTQVKNISIFDQKDDAGNYGYVAAGTDPSSAPSWQIQKFEDGKLYCTGKSQRIFEVVKAEKELILKEGTTTYFFKQFKQ